MKTWTRRYEWVNFINCADSPLHTTDNLTPEEVAQAAEVCSTCQTRPECIEWALRDKACAVMVAGTYLPDPMFKRELRAAHNHLRNSLASEYEARGGDV